MTPFPDERVQELLVEALKRPAADRIPFLDEFCADEPSVRTELEKLLAAHEEAPEFLAPPAAEKFLDFHDRAEFGAGESSGPRIGDHIGRYKLLELLGEGGFGTVFLAEQERPIRRRVAVKVIKPGMDSRQVLARFTAERQALALMDHSNIAKVYDAGQTKSGRPYVVMELLEGPSITEYCKLHRLSTDERVELFISVCHAVQHAHQKGIIHRDLKPSNVLVVTQEDRPVAKVIDFGIAKALSGSLPGHTFLTEQRQLLGTPEYVSPEQAGMGEIAIDTRTDVYSLGVLLYELLTGTTPFDPTELRRASFYQMQRMIIEEDPPRPSSRLSSMGGQLAEIAAARRVDPRLLRRQLKGDLDWIVMKCLCKSPAERYATAAALADDLNHYLNDEPVTAAAQGNIYQLRKLVRRHRAWFAGGVAVALALAGGTVVSTLLYVQAEAARHEQEVLKQQADASALAAMKAASNTTAMDDFLIQTLGFADPENAGRANMPLRDVLGLAERKLDKGSLAAQPELEASVRAQLAKIDESVGLFSHAEAQVQAALKVWDRLPHPNGRAQAQAEELLADIYWTVSDFRRAEPAYRKAIDLNQRFPGDRPDHAGRLWIMLGRVLMYGDHLDQAEPPISRGLQIISDAQGAQSYQLAKALRYLEQVYMRRNLPKQVLAVRGRRRRIYQHLLTPQARASLSDGDLADVRREVGFPYDQEQEKLLTQALQQERSKHGEYDPAVARATEDLADCLLYSCRDYSGAEKLLRQALAIRQTLYGQVHPQVAGAFSVLATFLEARDQYPEAVQCAREAQSIVEECYSPTSHEALREKLRLALREERLGDYDSAARHVREVVVENDAVTTDLDQYRLRTRLAAYLLWTQCDYPQAEHLCRHLLAVNPDQDPGNSTPTLWLLANTLISEGRFDEALKVSQQAVDNCTTAPVAPLIGPGVKIAVFETHARALFLAGNPSSAVDAALRNAQQLWDAASESFKQLPHDGSGFTTVDRTAHPRSGLRTETLLNVGRYPQARVAAEKTAEECVILGFAPGSRQRHYLDLMLAVARAGCGDYDPAREAEALRAYASVRDDPHILRVYQFEAHQWIADLYEKWKEPAKLAAWKAQSVRFPPNVTASLTSSMDPTAQSRQPDPPPNS